MMDYRQLEALALVHRRGSFEAAAGSLGVTPSAISQRIKALEDRLGALLIRRGTPARATEAGLRLIAHHDAVALMEAGLDLAPPGPVRLGIAVNADSLATWVLPALAEVSGPLFDLVITDQEVSQDWLKRGEVAAAITAHPGPLQGCDTHALGALRYLATASPQFIARHLPQGVSAQSLARAPSLRYDENDRLQDIWAARHFPGLPALPCHRIASSQGFVEAALLGIGWGMNPESLVRPHLASGALVALMPEAPLDVPLYWQFARASARAIAPVTQAIRRGAASALIPCGGGPGLASAGAAPPHRR